jgi:hypothetical protein
MEKYCFTGLAKSGEESYISYEESSEGQAHDATWIAKCKCKYWAKLMAFSGYSNVVIKQLKMRSKE